MLHIFILFTFLAKLMLPPHHRLVFMLSASLLLAVYSYRTHRGNVHTSYRGSNKAIRTILCMAIFVMFLQPIFMIYGPSWDSPGLGIFPLQKRIASQVKGGQALQNRAYMSSDRPILLNPYSRNLKIHFIDVGQADCTLIHIGGRTMLIDGGENNDAQRIVDYIKEQGIKKLDYVVNTHPHQDHAGGLDAAIRSFQVGQVLMPDVNHHTKTFQDVLAAIREKNLTVKNPVPGEEYALGRARFRILAPNSKNYRRLNDYSIVIKLSYGENSFLFQGDAEAKSEEEILKKGFDIRADLLKVGHHGHKSSTTPAYFQTVQPRYAVISVGRKNEYGLPHDVVVKRLQSAGIKIYRTDRHGTVIAESDGKKIAFTTEK
jgi:competence protein ComEC